MVKRETRLSAQCAWVSVVLREVIAEGTSTEELWIELKNKQGVITLMGLYICSIGHPKPAGDRGSYMWTDYRRM